MAESMLAVLNSSPRDEDNSSRRDPSERRRTSISSAPFLRHEAEEKKADEKADEKIVKQCAAC
jgi:hypothetical protein